MSILSDKEIRERCVSQPPMIEPFVSGQIKEHQGTKLISYGVSSYGYDARAAADFRVFTNAYGNVVVDPKEFNTKAYVQIEDDVCIIPPNSFALARTIEYFRMPRNVTALVQAKSTYARCGLSVPPTVIEAGWEGHITLEFINSTPLPAKLYANEGCVQLIFFRGEHCETSYADRNGKYQGQTGVTHAKVG